MTFVSKITYLVGKVISFVGEVMGGIEFSSSGFKVQGLEFRLYKLLNGPHGRVFLPLFQDLLA